MGSAGKFSTPHFAATKHSTSTYYRDVIKTSNERSLKMLVKRLNVKIISDANIHDADYILEMVSDDNTLIVLGEYEVDIVNNRENYVITSAVNGDKVQSFSEQMSTIKQNGILFWCGTMIVYTSFIDEVQAYYDEDDNKTYIKLTSYDRTGIPNILVDAVSRKEMITSEIARMSNYRLSEKMKASQKRMSDLEAARKAIYRKEWLNKIASVSLAELLNEYGSHWHAVRENLKDMTFNDYAKEIFGTDINDWEDDCDYECRCDRH